MYDVEVVGGDQRQRLAEMLRANALNAPQGQMVSGWYVPPSWSQNLAHLAQTATGVLGAGTCPASVTLLRGPLREPGQAGGRQDQSAAV